MARGNSVMKAKRVTGPTPHSELLLRCRMAKCDVKGCEEEPLVTVPTAGNVKRTCALHLLSPRATPEIRVPGGWKPAWMRA